MKPTTHAFFFVALLLLCLGACREDEPSTAPSRAELLMQSWQLQSQEVTGILYQGEELSVSFVEQAFGVTFPEEIFPNGTTLTFSSDGTYLIADPASGESFPGTWSLHEEEDILNLTINTEVINLPSNTNQAYANIETLTEEQLTLLLVVEDIEVQGDSAGGRIRLNFSRE